MESRPRALAGVLLSALFFSAGIPAGEVVSQVDPIELQQRAVRRLDGCLDQLRRTADFQSQQGELERVISDLTLSNAALARQGDSSALALGLTQQGAALRMLGRFGESASLYGKGAEVAERCGQVAAQAEALAWKALAESNQSDLGSALADVQRAVALARDSRDQDVLARALRVMGIVQIRQRDLGGAADTLSKEFEAVKGARDPTAAYHAYVNRADLNLKIAEECDHKPLFAACLAALDLADSDVRKALGIVQRLGYRGLEVWTQRIADGHAVRRKLIELRRRMFEQKRQMDDLFKPKQARDVFANEVFVTPNDGWRLMLPLLEAADREEQKAGALGQAVEARRLAVRGQMRVMQGRFDEALDWYRKAVEVLERERRSLRDERARGTFMEDRVEIYYATALLLLQQKRQADAFALLERARSRVLADLLASRTLSVGGPEQTLYAAASALRARLADAQGRLLEPAPSDGEETAGEALAKQIETDQAAYHALLERMATEAPRLHELVDSQPASLRDLQESMRREGYEVLQYMVTENGVALWHITPSSVFVRSVVLPRAVLKHKVAALRAGLEDPTSAFTAESASELFLFLIQPALSEIRSQRLVIIPHEALNNLPFQVLRDPSDGRYLAERFQISYAPSATVLLGLEPSAPLRGARVLAGANPDLRGAKAEVEAIGRVLSEREPAPSKRQGDAVEVLGASLPRETDVKRLAAGRDLVHLAVHGHFDAGEPMLSYLDLAPGDGDDGRLTAAEMFGLPIAKTRLVTLSACETGRAEATSSNESLGMSRALLYAGANALLLSQWEVASDATGQWMAAFYRAAREQPLPAAARSAALAVKNTPGFAHPFYWAAFTLIAR